MIYNTFESGQAVLHYFVLKIDRKIVKSYYSIPTHDSHLLINLVNHIII